MKVFVEPPAHLSQAMFRVARALRENLPTGVELAPRPEEADVHVLHVIGSDAVSYQSPAKKYAVLQYCVATAGESSGWSSFWNNATATWSYYDLKDRMNGACFYHAPLGIDKAFTEDFIALPRDVGVMTSGYVAGPGAEAIEEVALAAWMLGMSSVHLGPKLVEGMRTQTELRSILGVSDAQLAGYYRRCKWVSGLRYVEGFELPALEGLACGARPIVFDRPDMYPWYTGHAVFVPECTGEDLVQVLLDVFDSEPDPVLPDERQWILDRFNWKPIVKGFWERALA